MPNREPYKKDGDHFNDSIKVYLTPTQKKTFESKAAKKGESMSVIVRRLLSNIGFLGNANEKK